MMDPYVYEGTDVLKNKFNIRDSKELKIKETEACINLLNQINWEEKDLDQKSELFTKLIAGLWQVHPFRDGNTRAIMAFAFEFAREHGFDMNKDVFLRNFTYVRDAFVMASIGEYSESQYLNQRVKTAIKLGKSIDKDIDIEFGTDNKQNTDQQHHEENGNDVR